MNALAPVSKLDGEQLLARLDEIERALKFTPDRRYRRELVVEYLRLTDPEPEKSNEIDF